MRRIIAMLMVLMLLPALALAEAVGDEPVVSEALFDAVEEQGEIELAAPEEIAGPAAEVMAPEAPEAIEAVDALLPKAAEVTKLTLGVGETYTLSIQNIKSCRSDHKSVAEVSGKGVVTAKKTGSATITVKQKSGRTKEVKVTVKKAPKELTLNRTKKSLEVGKTFQLTVTLPGNTAWNKLTWKSSDKSVAKVSASGKVTAVKAGQATITVKAGKVTASCAVTVKSSKQKIGVSMPTDSLSRWKGDGERIASGLKKAGFEVVLKYADNKVATQVSQVKSMIDGGCAALVIASINGSSLTDQLDKARKKGIPVVAYDRLLTGSKGVSAYVTFGSTAVGKVQGQFIRDALKLDTAKGPFHIEFTAGDPGDANAEAFFNGAMSVLKPYIKSGKLKVLSGQTAFKDVSTKYWMTDNAKARAEKLLSNFYADGTDIDAWLCSNDSTAQGVIAALDQYYLGDWPVITGQDCDIANVRYILAGKQSMSVFKDTRDMADRAVTMVKQLVTGATLKVNDTKTYDNGAIVVPAYLVAPGYVTSGNYKVLIDAGYYSASDLEG